MAIRNDAKELEKLKLAAREGTPERRLRACRRLLDRGSRRARDFARAQLRDLAKSGDPGTAAKAGRLLESPQKGRKRREAPKAEQGAIPRHPQEPDWESLGVPDPRSVGSQSEVPDSVRRKLKPGTGAHQLWWYLFQASHGGFAGLEEL